MKKKVKQTKRKETILIVDDDYYFLSSISMLLVKVGYSILTAIDGEKGWLIFKENQPDLVITDLRMPDVDGFELMTRIKSETTSTPVITFTWIGDNEYVKKAYEMGADEFISKSDPIEDLLRKVKNLLNKSKEEKELHRLKNLSDSLQKENKLLKKRIEELSESPKIVLSLNEAKNYRNYRAICGEVGHGLKGEFLHIGYSLKEIRELGNQSREIIEECDMIERSLTYSQLLMQRLLNYMDTGSLQIGPLDLLELIRKTVELARPRLPSNIKLKIDIAPNIKETKISANLEQLMAVLLELINNASKVLRQKGGNIRVKLEKKNKNVEVSVKDDGPGIPGELKNKILKEQVPSKNGLGLGLYLCGKTIKQFGGELKVKTADGEGTTITMILPTVEEKKE